MKEVSNSFFLTIILLLSSLSSALPFTNLLNNSSGIEDVGLVALAINTNQIAYGLIVQNGLALVRCYNLSDQIIQVQFQSSSFLSIDSNQSFVILTPDYILAGQSMLNVFDYSLQYVTNISASNINFVLYLESKNSIVYKNQSGSVFEINLNNIFNPSFTLIIVSTSLSFLSVDDSEKYLLVCTSSTRQIIVKNTTNWSTVTSFFIWTNFQGATFFIRGNLLMVLTVHSPYLNVYDATRTFTYIQSFNPVGFTLTQSVQSMVFDENSNNLIILLSDSTVFVQNMVSLVYTYPSFHLQPYSSSSLTLFSSDNFMVVSTFNRTMTFLYKQNSNQGMSTCNNGYYLDFNSQCSSCPTYCYTCLNSYTCQACYHNVSWCCNSLQFPNYQTNQCQNCSVHCLSCTGTNQCITCDNLTSLYQGLCCNGSSYYSSINSSCVSCPSNCLSCTNSSVCTNYVANISNSNSSSSNNSTINSSSSNNSSSNNSSTNSSSSNTSLINNLSCRSGQYYDSLIDDCQPCSSICTTCNTSQQCITKKYQSTPICEQMDTSIQRSVCDTWMSSPAIQSLTSVTQALARTPTLRLFLKILSPFFFFNDEYSYYPFHNTNYSNLVVTATFFSILQNINDQRLLPFDFLDNIQNQISTSNFIQENYTIYAIQGKFVPPTEDIYFLNNVQSMVIWGYLSIILAMLGVAFIIFLLDLFLKQGLQTGSKFPKLFYIRNFLRRKVTIWYFFIGIIQTNAIVIAFYFSRQIKLPFYSFFVDKLNLIFSLFLFFVCLLYSLIFYAVMFAFNSKIAKYIIQAKKSGKFSFNYQIIRQVMKNLAIGTIHGGLLGNYLFQISALLFFRLLYFYSVLKSKCYYRQYAEYIIDIICSIISIIFDALLLVSYCHYQLGIDNQFLQTILIGHDYVELTIVIGLISCVLSKICNSVVIKILIMTRSWKKINKVLVVFRDEQIKQQQINEQKKLTLKITTALQDMKKKMVRRKIKIPQIAESVRQKMDSNSPKYQYKLGKDYLKVVKCKPSKPSMQRQERIEIEQILNSRRKPTIRYSHIMN